MIQRANSKSSEGESFKTKRYPKMPKKIAPLAVSGTQVPRNRGEYFAEYEEEKFRKKCLKKRTFVIRVLSQTLLTNFEPHYINRNIFTFTEKWQNYCC